MSRRRDFRPFAALVVLLALAVLAGAAFGALP